MIFFSLFLYYKANSQQTCLINVTLETLLRFLNWIPLGYIFETDLIGQLISTFLVLPAFRNITLKCLTEIVSINAEIYREKFVQLFSLSMDRLKQVHIRLSNFKINIYIYLNSTTTKDSSSEYQFKRCL